MVAAQAFHFGHTMRNAVVRVDLRTHSDLYLTLTSELVSLVPGTLVMEARRQESVVYLHVMDVRSEPTSTTARRKVLEAEERVVRSLRLGRRGGGVAGGGTVMSVATVIIMIGGLLPGRGDGDDTDPDVPRALAPWTGWWRPTWWSRWSSPRWRWRLR